MEFLLDSLEMKRSDLADKVDDNDVQDDVSEDEVGEASFRRYSNELRLVLWVGLKSQAHWNELIRELKPVRCGVKRQLTTEDEAADGRDEAGQEGIERECADEHAISELQNSSQQNVDEISVDKFELLGRVVLVLVVELRQH